MNEKGMCFKGNHCLVKEVYDWRGSTTLWDCIYGESKLGAGEIGIPSGTLNPSHNIKNILYLFFWAKSIHALA
jgi:hypothetical protein